MHVPRVRENIWVVVQKREQRYDLHSGGVIIDYGN